MSCVVGLTCGARLFWNDEVGSLQCYTGCMGLFLKRVMDKLYPVLRRNAIYNFRRTYELNDQRIDAVRQMFYLQVYGATAA